MKRFVLFSMLFLAFFGLNALEVNQPELESVGKDTIEFINYTGPHTVINTKDEISGIGSALGEKIAPNVANNYAAGDNNVKLVTKLLAYGAFIDNENDSIKLKNNLTKYAEAVVKAVSEYAGYNYTLPGEKPNQNNEIYIVQKGDSLWSIANKNNTTVDKLKDINKLNSNLLSVGQKLLIPNSSTNNKQYVVKSGDTLYKIAQNNGTTVTDIINLNNLPTTNLSIGQILYLP